MRRRRRTYKSPHEKLFRDELPKDGQKIAFRGYAQKTYFSGTWNAEKRSVSMIRADREICIDHNMGRLLAFGWYPVQEIKDDRRE